MSIDSLENNVKHMKEIIREAYIFSNQLGMIKELENKSNIAVNSKEKQLLEEVISALLIQLKILNNSIPDLLYNLGFYKDILDKNVDIKTETLKKFDKNLIQVNYQTPIKDQIARKISLTISENDKKEFLDNLSKSSLTMSQLQKNFSVERAPIASFGKPNFYAKLSNHFFRKLSYSLIEKGYFTRLNKDLRKMNSPFVLGTYVSMIFFTCLIVLFLSIILFIVLMFVNIGITFPFFTSIPNNETIIDRIGKYFWILLALPLGTAVLMYFYPSSEAKSIGSKIEQELPFVAIHMGAIATSGVQPLNIFRIILKSEEYPNTNIEFTKIMNLINFHGKDPVTALKDSAKSSASSKLRELLDGIATSITSGGDLKDFLSKHAENLLFDYKLEREKYTKTAETFMDIYISIVIAAPMIFLMLFVIMGSTGTLSNFIGMSVDAVNFLIIGAIAVLNIGFLIFLKMKQPTL